MKKILSIVFCCFLVALLVLPAFATPVDYPQYSPSDLVAERFQYALWDDGFVFEGKYYSLQSNLSVPYIYPYAIYHRDTQVHVWYLDLRTDSASDIYFDVDSGGVFAPVIRFSRYDIQADGSLKYVGATYSTPFRTWENNLESVRGFIKYSRIDIPWKDTFNAPYPFISAYSDFVYYPENFLLPHWVIPTFIFLFGFVALVVISNWR